MVIMNKKKKIIRYLKSILFVSVFLTLSTIFIFLPNNTEMAGALGYLSRLDSIIIRNISDDLSLEYNFPISDNMGKKTEAYLFEIQNISSTTETYNIVFQTGMGSDITKLDNNAVKYMLYKDDELIKDISVLQNDGIIITDELIGKSSAKYSLKFWITKDTTCDLSGKTFAPTISFDVIK